VKAFWGGNDDISIGIMHALDATGRSGGGDYFIAGLNWSAPALKLVKNGKMLLTHGGHFFAGAWSMVVIYDHKKGIDFITESVDLMFPMSAITRQNVDRYANTFKLPKDWKKINYKRFTKTHNTDIKKYDFSLKNIFLHTQYP
jgi:ABC-type sugar transport system substrate-binding protein